MTMMSLSVLFWACDRITASFFLRFFKPVTPCGAQATDHSSPSSSILGCCLHLLPVVCEACYFHFFLHISLLCILWSPYSTLSIRCPLRHQLAFMCSSQFHFILRICTSTYSRSVSLFRSSLAILSGQCTCTICLRHLCDCPTFRSSDA